MRLKGLIPPVYCAAGLIVLIGWMAYQNSFAGPFIFDDQPSILENLSIRHLWPPPFFAARETVTASSRPLTNISLALNYAVGGLDVRGYHLTNLLIHLLAALTLFGITRRTLLLPVMATRFGKAALPLGLAVALLWVVHPLQTEAVTYIVQRAESMMGLFYFLTLYTFIRSVTSEHAHRWLLLSVSACFLGALSKEIIFTAPLVVFLYDRTFVSGGLREAWGRRWRYYAILACIWPLIVMLLSRQTLGNVGGLTWWIYGLTELKCVTHYLWLSLWPHPLVFDPGTDFILHFRDALPYGLFLSLPLGSTAFCLAHIPTAKRVWPAFGFVGAWIFLILAPSSTVVPLADPEFEYRMYLPLAGVVVFFVMTAYHLCGRRAVLILLPALAVLITLTLLRNHDYRSNLSIWGDTVALRPLNPRAHNNLGEALGAAGRFAEARRELAAAARLQPGNEAHWENLAHVQFLLGHPEKAASAYERVIKLKPNKISPYFNLGVAEMASGRPADALANLQHFCSLASTTTAEDHARLLIWCLRATGNDEAGAADDLADSLRHQWRSGPDEPVTKEAQFLLGRLNEGQLVAAAQAASPAEELGALCEAWFVAGMKKRVEGDNAAAAEDFRRCQATGETEFVEYMLASAELRSGPPFTAP